jgi:hypothetical protein
VPLLLRLVHLHPRQMLHSWNKRKSGSIYINAQDITRSVVPSFHCSQTKTDLQVRHISKAPDVGSKLMRERQRRFAHVIL